MRFYVYFHVQIARNARLHGFPLLGQAYHLAVIDTGRNSNLDFFFFAMNALPLALRAFFFRYFPTAKTDSAYANAAELSED